MERYLLVDLLGQGCRLMKKRICHVAVSQRLRNTTVENATVIGGVLTILLRTVIGQGSGCRRTVIRLLELWCYRMVIGPCIIVIVEELKTNLMSLAVFISLIFAQHVSNISMSIFRSLRLWWWIITSVILFSIRCVLGFAVGDAWWCPFCRLKH
jgi:hypothetical protein